MSVEEKGTTKRPIAFISSLYLVVTPTEQEAQLPPDQVPA
jgi:hypothetical protein